MRDILEVLASKTYPEFTPMGRVSAKSKFKVIINGKAYTEFVPRAVAFDEAWLFEESFLKAGLRPGKDYIVRAPDTYNEWTQSYKEAAARRKELGKPEYL